MYCCQSCATKAIFGELNKLTTEYGSVGNLLLHNKGHAIRKVYSIFEENAFANYVFISKLSFSPLLKSHYLGVGDIILGSIIVQTCTSSNLKHVNFTCFI
jgi:hypothetical protein